MREGLIAGPEPEPEAAAKTTIGDAIDAYLRYPPVALWPIDHTDVALEEQFTQGLCHTTVVQRNKRGRDERVPARARSRARTKEGTCMRRNIIFNLYDSATTIEIARRPDLSRRPTW